MARSRQRQREPQVTPRLDQERVQQDSNGHASVGRRQVKVLGALSGLLLGVVTGTAGAVYRASMDEVARALAEVARVRADTARELERVRDDSDEKVRYLMQLCGLD